MDLAPLTRDFDPNIRLFFVRHESKLAVIVQSVRTFLNATRSGKFEFFKVVVENTSIQSLFYIVRAVAIAAMASSFQIDLGVC